MTTTLERVRAAVIKAVPSLAREVEQKPMIRCPECVDGLACDENGESVDVCINCAGTHTIPSDGKKLLVATRDITLADVIRALEAGGCTGFTVKQGGRVWLNEYTMFTWNLALPLHLQGKIVWSFLDKTLNHD